MLGQTLELSGDRKVTYESLGSGEPMFVLVGGPGYGGEWERPDAEILAERFTAYLIDPHGSGGSTPPATDDDYTAEGHVRFYDEVRRALELDRIHLYGHSFGAVVALTYAGSHPEVALDCVAVSGLGLGGDADSAEGGGAVAEMEAKLQRHSGAPWFPDAKRVWDTWTERVLTTDDSTEVDEMMRSLMPAYFAYPDRPEIAERIEATKPLVKCDLRAIKVWESGGWQRIDLRPYLARISCPTLVMAGEMDLVGAAYQAKLIADATPGADLVLFPDCGHFPSIEVPGRFRDAVFSWFDKRG